MSTCPSKSLAASFCEDPCQNLHMLPTELIEHIVSFLPGSLAAGKEVVEPPCDAFNLRLVCRDLECKLRYWFVHKHILSQESEFQKKGRIFIEPHYESIRTFHHLAANEPIANAIQSLFVNTMMVNKDRLSRCIESLGGTQDMFLEWEENLPVLAKRRDVRLVDCVAKDVAQMRSRCYRCYYDQQWLFASNEDQKLLDEALGRLRFLKELQVCSHDYSYLWSTTGGIDFVRDYTGIFKDAVTTADNEVLDRRTAVLLSLVIKNNVSVKKLIVSHSEGVAAWVLDKPSHHFQQMNITKLLVRLSNGEKRTNAPPGWSPQKGYTAFLRLLSALPHLRSLSIAPAESTFFNPSFVARVLHSCSSSLSKLHLFDLVVCPRDLERLLDTLRPSLKRLSLSKLHLIDASWQRVVRQTILYPLDNFSNLALLRLGPLYELQKDRYYCIEFPHAEERRGYEYQREGHWSKGFWFCPVDSRYSVDVGGTAAGSDAAGRLRAGLVDALASAVSVRCEYDQVAGWPYDFKHIEAKTAAWAREFFGGDLRSDALDAKETSLSEEKELVIPPRHSPLYRSPTIFIMDTPQHNSIVTSIHGLEGLRRLETLPPEMFNAIVQYIDFKDIVSLKAVSRSVDSLVLKTFVKHIQGEGNESFRANGNLLEVDSSPQGFKYLQVMTRINEVRLPATSLNMRVSLADDERSRDLNPPEFPDNIRIGLPDELDVELEKFEQLCHKYRQDPSALAEMQAKSEDIPCIAEALNSTENLTVARLRGVRSPENWWKYTPSVTSISKAATKAAFFLLAGIIFSKTQITGLELDRVVLEDEKTKWIDPHGNQHSLIGAILLSTFEYLRLSHARPIQGLQNLTTFDVTI
ncbi:hypothetical protein IWX48DRAFT_652539 [Phyllosticta citricarpa]